MCSFMCCGIFCSGLAVFCGIVLLVTGIFLWFETQSIFLPHDVTHHDAAINCFVGVAIYAVILALSIGCICWGRFKAKRTAANAPLTSRPLNTTIQ